MSTTYSRRVAIVREVNEWFCRLETDPDIDIKADGISYEVSIPRDAYNVVTALEALGYLKERPVRHSQTEKGAPFDEDLEKGRARARCTHPEDAYTRLDAVGKEEEP